MLCIENSLKANRNWKKFYIKKYKIKNKIINACLNYVILFEIVESTIFSPIFNSIQNEDDETCKFDLKSIVGVEQNENIQNSNFLFYSNNFLIFFFVPNRQFILASCSSKDHNTRLKNLEVSSRRGNCCSLKDNR